MERLEEKDTIEYYIHALPEVYSERTAILWRGSYRMESYTYHEIHDYACRAVSLLGTLGIEKGDRVCVWAYNSPSWPVFFFGCLLSGVVIVPIDFNSSPDFVNVIIDQVGAKAILLSRLKDTEAPGQKVYAEDLLEKLRRFSPVPPGDLPRIEPDDLVEIVYTSGTTSDPKGVLITNMNLISNIRSLRYMMPLDSSYRLLSILPLSHLFEQVLGLFYPLRFGATILYTSTRKSSAIKRMLKKHGVTTVVCVPFFLDSIRDNIIREAQHRRVCPILRVLLKVSRRLPFPVRRVLSFPLRHSIGQHLRSFICGGSKLDEATEDFWMALGIRIIQGYGLTEASPVVTCNTIHEYKAHTVGRSLPRQELRILDDGEILVRGRNVTPGYYQNPEATRAAFDGEWYKTGDIGEFDSDGFLTIRGRKKDMILTSSGLNVFPQDIESQLNSLPSVVESCVVGLEKNGKTTIHAAVIRQPACAEAIEKIVATANRHLNPSQKIQCGSLWADKTFPKTATLKIKKHEVVRALTETDGSKLRKGPLAQPARDRSDLQELLASHLQLRTWEIQDHLKIIDDLGLDSLALVELVVLLEERFHIEFDESNLGAETTISDLQRLIDSSARTAVKIPDISWARSLPACGARRLLQALMNVYLKIILDLEIQGRELLNEVALPAIFVANHTSHFDSPVLLRALPPAIGRETAVAAAADYFFGIEGEPKGGRPLAQRILPILAPLLLNAFPLSRRKSIRRSLDLLGEVLDDGWSVILYPEGTRSITGEMATFKPGIGLIAAEMRVPVVPVRLEGLHDVLPKGRVLPRRGRSKVIFGRPLLFERHQAYLSIARKIEDALRRL